MFCPRGWGFTCSLCPGGGKFGSGDRNEVGGRKG